MLALKVGNSATESESDPPIDSKIAVRSATIVSAVLAFSALEAVVV
jgi:hypothetical protein